MENFVLIVDDEKEDFLIIARSLSEYKIISEYASTTEEMMKLLPKIHHKLTAIILDIRGKRNNEQSVENKDFITYTIRKLDKHKDYRSIKKYVVSKYPQDSNNFMQFFGINEDIELFSKKLEDLTKLAISILEYGKKKKEILIRNEYYDIFNVFSNYNLHYEYEKDLQNILLDLDTNDKNKIKDYLLKIRIIGEHIYKSAARKLEKTINLTNFSEINKEFAGNRDYKNKARPTTKYYYKDQVIEHAFNTIHWIGSYHGAHSSHTLNVEDIDPQHFPTPYTLKTVVYSLLDIILWYDRFMQEHSNKEE